MEEDGRGSGKEGTGERKNGVDGSNKEVKEELLTFFLYINVSLKYVPKPTCFKMPAPCVSAYPFDTRIVHPAFLIGLVS
jgi:hypothetical protein